MKKYVATFLLLSMGSLSAFAHSVECYSTAMQKGYDFHFEIAPDKKWSPTKRLLVSIYKKELELEKDYCVLKKKKKHLSEIRYVRPGVKLIINYAPDHRPIAGKTYPATYYDRSLEKGVTFNKIECEFNQHDELIDN